MISFSLTTDDSHTIQPQLLIHSSLGVFYCEGGHDITESTQIVLDNSPWTDFLARAIYSDTPLSLIARHDIKKMPRWTPQPVTLMTTPDIITHNNQWTRYRYCDDEPSQSLLKRAMNYSSSLPHDDTLDTRLHQTASVYKNIQRTAEQHTSGTYLRLPLAPDHIIHNMVEIVDESYYLSTTARLSKMTHDAYLYKYGRSLAHVLSLVRRGDSVTPLFSYPAHTLSLESIRYHVLLSAFMIDDVFDTGDNVGWMQMKKLLDHTLSSSFTALDRAFSPHLPYPIS